MERLRTWLSQGFQESQAGAGECAVPRRNEKPSHGGQETDGPPRCGYRDIRRAWNNFVKDFPNTLNIARDYGTDRCCPDDNVTSAWEDVLVHLQITPKLGAMGGMAAFQSGSRALHQQMGQGRSAIGDECRHRAVTNYMWTSMRVILHPWDHSQSVYEDLEGSTAEIDRLVSKGFAAEMSKQEAEQVFGTGTISKMTLLTKIKD